MKCPVEFTGDLSAQMKAAGMLEIDNPGSISAAAMERMMKLQDIILKAMAKKINWMEVAEIAGVTDRRMRRIRERYKEFGYTGLFDQRRGKRSIHWIPMQTAEEVLRLYREVPFRRIIEDPTQFRPLSYHLISQFPRPCVS